MSQELIYTQIPWASAGAERSRQYQNDLIASGVPIAQQMTQEEVLLAEILKANEELTDALREYADLIAQQEEMETKEISRMEYITGQVS